MGFRLISMTFCWGFETLWAERDETTGPLSVLCALENPCPGRETSQQLESECLCISCHESDQVYCFDPKHSHVAGFCCSPGSPNKLIFFSPHRGNTMICLLLDIGIDHVTPPTPCLHTLAHTCKFTHTAVCTCTHLDMHIRMHMFMGGKSLRPKPGRKSHLIIFSFYFFNFLLV